MMPDPTQVPFAPAVPRDRLRHFIQAFQLSQCVFAAAELGLADLLLDGPRPVTELAAASGTQPQALSRLMHTLVSLGIFRGHPGEVFELNETARLLCKDEPGSLRPLALLYARQYSPTWSHLLLTLRSGGTTFDALHGMDVWQHRAQDAAAGELFTTAMSGIDQASASAVIAAYDFSPFKVLVDVGGGKGAQLAAILQATPGLRGVLFDLENVLPLAEQTLIAAGVWQRCQVTAGSFLEPMLLQGDAFLLKRVLHDWDDQNAALILANCRAALHPGQVLLVVERLLPADHASPEPFLTDLMMMVMNGGRERSQAEFQTLLEAAGFALRQVLPTPSVLFILEAQAVQV